MPRDCLLKSFDKVLLHLKNETEVGNSFPIAKYILEKKKTKVKSHIHGASERILKAGE